MGWKRALIVAVGMGLAAVWTAPWMGHAQGQRRELPITSLSSSDIVGFAAVTEMPSDRLKVEIHLAQGMGPQPTHIHEGSCADKNPAPKLMLADVTSGISITELAAPTAQLMAAPHSIHVHRSREEMAALAACVDVPRSYGQLGMMRLGEADLPIGMLAGLWGFGFALVATGVAFQRRAAARGMYGANRSVTRISGFGAARPLLGLRARMVGLRGGVPGVRPFLGRIRQAVLFSRNGPALDMYQDGRNLVVEMALPGVSADAIDISIGPRSFTIRGGASDEDARQRRTYLIREERMRPSQFSRSVPLPEMVDKDAADATFRDGLLRVIMPTVELPPPRRVHIRSISAETPTGPPTTGALDATLDEVADAPRRTARAAREVDDL